MGNTGLLSFVQVYFLSYKGFKVLALYGCPDLTLKSDTFRTTALYN